MSRCLCSHFQAQHFAHSGVCWGTGCGCVCFEADSDAPVPESVLSPGSQFVKYEGIYADRKWSA